MTQFLELILGCRCAEIHSGEKCFRFRDNRRRNYLKLFHNLSGELCDIIINLLRKSKSFDEITVIQWYRFTTFLKQEKRFS